MRLPWQYLQIELAGDIHFLNSSTWSWKIDLLEYIFYFD
jgi:hypothetical protein